MHSEKYIREEESGKNAGKERGKIACDCVDVDRQDRYLGPAGESIGGGVRV